MRPKRSPPLPKTSAFYRLSEGLPRYVHIPRKRKSAAWRRGRRPEMQPWRRGRIRPSSCHDLAEEA
jgi:hypothetical protein